MLQRYLPIALIVLALPLLPMAEAQERWEGNFQLSLAQDKVRPGGSITLEFDAIHRNRSRPQSVNDRDAGIWLIPQRFSLFDHASQQLSPSRATANSLRVSIPNDVAPGWYEVVVVMADDNGMVPTLAEALNNHSDHGNRTERSLIAITGDGSSPQIMIHTERSRHVFSPGEELRINVSGRQRGGIAADVVLALYPHDGQGRPMVIGRGQLQAAGNAVGTLNFDYPAQASQAIAPGDYYLVVIHNRQPVDRLAVRFIGAERPSGGARWAHTLPFGNTPGFDNTPSIPDRLQSPRYQGRIDQSLTRIHNANLWVNFFSNHYPIVGPGWDLPHADDPDMPPTAAFFRPSLTHAFYQSLMASGVALGITVGYGEDYRAEVYMPIPTQIDEHINTMARKYLNASLGASWLPNFVAAYTDYYGHMEFTGARELSAEQIATVRQSIWESAIAAAGIPQAEQPLHYEFHDRNIGGDAAQFFRSNRDARRSRSAWLDQKKEQYGGDDDWFKNNYTTETTRQQVWREYWQAVGYEGPIPEPTRQIPLPRLDSENVERFGRQADYDYTSYALRGIQRAYGRFTRFIEDELPSVFTIHNKSTMNHSSVSHAWTGTRTPNVDPAYLENAADVIAVSEWNIDGVPKPYFLTTFYNRFLVDRGHPVQHQGLWHPMGSPARFMRDAVFFAGRQMQVFFDQPGNMSWSHRGADQTTYASNERMASVTEFLSWYTDLIPRLEPVREVGLYVPAEGGPWGVGVTRGHYVAMVASLMTDHQVHMVSHGDIHDDRLGIYPIIYAPSIHGPDRLFPFEQEGLRAFMAAGGEVVVSQAPNYFHPPEVYTRYGISMERVPELDDEGEPRTNRDGSIRTRNVWTETPEQWARVTREYVWEAFEQNKIHAVPINVHELYTHLDEDGNPATWPGRHWTGHHNWARYRGSSLHQHHLLKEAYNALLEPIITKDEPEVFVNVNRVAGDQGDGLWIFASNWQIPDHPDMMEKRVVQGHFNSAVMPVQTTLGLRDEGVGAIYDLLLAEAVDLRREGGRVYFSAALDGVEGRIFVALPEAIASVQLHLPQQVSGGDTLRPRLSYVGESGNPLAIMGNAELVVEDNHGRIVTRQRRAVAKDGLLPSVVVPAGVESLTVRVTDTISGRIAEYNLAVTAAPLAAVAPSAAVTTYRADRMHQWFTDLKAANEEIVVVVDSGNLEFTDDGITVKDANPHQAQLQRWADQMATALRAAGLRARVATSQTAVQSRLSAHPWVGEMAGYRARHSVPGYRIDGPVVIVGSPRTSPIIRQMDRAMVLQRSAGPDNVSGSRSLVAWAARSFSIDAHTVVVALDDDAAVVEAAQRLQAIASQRQPMDTFYHARERIRQAWTPNEVLRLKERRGLISGLQPAAEEGGITTISADGRWDGLMDVVGTAVFDMHATEAGVALATKSWVKPTGVIRADGDILGFWGGEDEVTPRDVGLSADGTKVAAGYSLMGRSVIYDTASGERLVKHRSGIVHSADPFNWDTFKESDRHISVSPDGRQFLLASTEALIAYDANSGSEQWRIPLAIPDDRTQGHPQPEMAYAPDGSHVLVSILVRDPQHKRVEIVVNRWNQRDDGSWDTRNSSPTPLTLTGELVRRELWLVNTRTGEPKWRRLLEKTLVDVETGRSVWKLDGEVEYQQRINNRWRTFNAAEDHELPIVDGQPIREPSRLRVPFWHLYSTVGPQGEWTILGARSATFTLLDDNGIALRTWEDRHMPSELRPGDMISPVIIPSSNPRRLLAFAPQRSTFYLFDLSIGDAATRRRARELQERHEAVLSLINDEIRNGRNYGNFGNREYLDAFAAKLEVVPEDLRRALIDRMAMIPGERRAGRRRDRRFFSSQVNDIITRLHLLGSDTFDAAAGLDAAQEIAIDAPINDAVSDADLGIIYAGLWDGTVRAIRVADGSELWRTPVVGGSRMAAVRNAQGAITALYAGGSRGDVYRLNPADGTVLWHHNITMDTNRFDP